MLRDNLLFLLGLLRLFGPGLGLGFVLWLAYSVYVAHTTPVEPPAPAPPPPQEA